MESYRGIFINEDGTLSDLQGNIIPREPVKTYPLQSYDIYMEGYRATGEQGTAQLLAKDVKGRSFQDACMRYALKSALEERENASETSYYDQKRWDYDPYRNAIWACKLFPTLEEAQKSYG